MPQCPYCDETIAAGLFTCPHCQSSLTPAAPPPSAPVQEQANGSSMAIWLMVIGGLVLSGVCVLGILIALLLPAVQGARDAARRAQCKNNLKQIGLALHNYHDVYGSFPPAYIPDATGKPMHSWRVLILPFLDQMPMYDEYDFSQPWNSPQNLAITQNIPQAYVCPTSPNSRNAHYVLITGKGTCFEGAESIKVSDITDGSSNTLLVVEAHDSPIPWSEPRDLDVSTLGHATGNPSSDHRGGFHVLYSDGRVLFVHDSIPPDQLKARITPNGQDDVGDH